MGLESATSVPGRLVRLGTSKEVVYAGVSLDLRLSSVVNITGVQSQFRLISRVEFNEDRRLDSGLADKCLKSRVRAETKRKHKDHVLYLLSPTL